MAEEKKKSTTSKNSNKKGTVKSGSKSTTTKKSPSKSTTKKTTTTKKNTTTKKATTGKTTSTKKTTTGKKSSSTKKSTTKKVTPVVKEEKVLETKKNNNIKIEIEKGNLIKGILIALGIIILCLICFFASNSNSSKYTESTSTDGEVSESSDTSGLEQATKEAGEVSDEERVEPNKISVNDYLELYKDDEYSLVLLSKESCGYCQIAIPIIENIIYKSDVKVNLIDVGSMTEEETADLVQSDSYFSEGYGTPLIMVVGNNSIKDKIEGLTTRDGYESFFKQYGFME